MDIQTVSEYFEPKAVPLQYARVAVEIICALIMLSAPFICYMFLVRPDIEEAPRGAVKTKFKQFIGEGVIRFLALAEIIPAIVILGLGGILDKASAGTLLAGVSGYVLGSMGSPRGPGGAGNTGSPKGYGNVDKDRNPQGGAAPEQAVPAKEASQSSEVGDFHTTSDLDLDDFERPAEHGQEKPLKT